MLRAVGAGGGVGDLGPQGGGFLVGAGGVGLSAGEKAADTSELGRDDVDGVGLRDLATPDPVEGSRDQAVGDEQALRNSEASVRSDVCPDAHVALPRPDLTRIRRHLGGSPGQPSMEAVHISS